MWICENFHKNDPDDSLCYICKAPQPETLSDRKALRIAGREKKEKKPIKRTAVKKVSDKRRAENAEYSKLRAVYLEQNPICEVCGLLPSTQIHHRKSRDNDMLLDVTYFLAVDMGCHEKIHNNPEWAYRNGYLVSRI